MYIESPGRVEAVLSCSLLWTKVELGSGSVNDCSLPSWCHELRGPPCRLVAASVLSSMQSSALPWVQPSEPRVFSKASRTLTSGPTRACLAPSQGRSFPGGGVCLGARPRRAADREDPVTPGTICWQFVSPPVSRIVVCTDPASASLRYVVVSVARSELHVAGV